MLILASASKARHQLLENVGISHRVIASDVDEDTFKESDPLTLVESLSIAKAQSVATKIITKYKDQYFHFENLALLACDSVFEFEGEIFGKPRNTQEAIYRLLRMSSKSGYIHTGHCFLFRPNFKEDNYKKEFRGMLKKVVTTKVSFSKMTLDDIRLYVSTGEPLQCAGGFALEGKGAVFIKSLDGCYSNVIGISLPWLKTAFFEAKI